MRILLATPLFPPDSGGPATYAKMLVDELPKHGIEVVLVKFGDVKHLPPGVRHVAYFLKCISRARGVDVVYALDPVSVGLPAALAALLLGKKFMLRVPGDYAWEQGRQRFGVTEELDEFQSKKYNNKVERLRRIQKFVANRAVHIVVPSEYMKRIVSGWVTDPSKIKVIYSSIKLPPEFTPLANRPEGFLVVSSGRRVPWKNFEAIERVVGTQKGWHFFLASQLPHKETMGWVQAADVFVLNSTYEGLSHALVEAMSLGTPVVATDVGGNPELIANGVEGLLIPAKDDKALLQALRNVNEYPEEARARAMQAKEKVKEFSIEKNIEKLVTLFKNI